VTSVRQWLEGLQLGEYAEAFESERIEFDDLAKLDATDLKEIGLPIGPRKRVTEAIGAMASDSRASTESGTQGSDRNKSAQADSEPQAERRQLTVMFCDLVGSTELSQQLDPEALRDLMRSYQQCCGAVIGKYDGHVAQYLGDGLMVYFGWPRAHEDGAERAIRAALEIVEAVMEIPAPDPLHVRIGIATGPVVVGETGEGDASVPKLAVGETPNLAARVQGLAEAGQIIVSSDTRRLVGNTFDLVDSGEHILRGIVDPVRAWRVTGVAATDGRFDAAHGIGGLTPLVGRDLELGFLMDRWSRARDGEGQVVLLAGEPGIGKSRILRALREKLKGEDANAMRFHCSPYHMNSAFWPSIDSFERVLKFDRSEMPDSKLDKLESLMVDHYQRPLADVRFIATMLSIPCEERYPEVTPTPQKFKDETLRSLVDLTETASRMHPSVMLFEDLHWADPTTLEVLDLMIERVKNIPLLIVLTHRPEFQNRWVDRGHVTSLNLSKLTRTQSGAMVLRVAGGKTLPPDLTDQILVRTDGVPLFVEELTKYILESGDLIKQDDRYDYTGNTHGVEIPETLRDSLMARLDQHAPAKEIAQIGAAIGREFSYELLSAIAPMGKKQLDKALTRLSESGLALRRGMPPGSTYIFKHALLRDAAYESLLKTRRQDLHGKIARAIERRFPNIRDLEPETLAHHYTETGTQDKAIPYWIEAGIRAVSRLAFPEAIAHLTRALTLLGEVKRTDQADAWEIEARINIGFSHVPLDGWGSPQIERMARPALELSARLGRPDQWIAACYLLFLHSLTTLHFVDALAVANKALEEGERLESDGHKLVGHGCLQWVNGQMGHHEIARQHSLAFDQAYSFERDGKNHILNDMNAWKHAWSAHHLWIMGFAEKALHDFRRGIDRARTLGNRMDLIIGLAHGGAIYFYMRNETVLRTCMDEASLLARENSLGFLDSMLISLWRGAALILGGDFREGYELVTAATTLSLDSNLPIMVPCHRLMTAEALAGMRRVDEAIRMLDGEIETIQRTGERIHEPELLRLRGVLTTREDASQVEVAEAFMRRAIDLSREQSAKSWELRASTSLARLWQQQGKHKEAHDLLNPVYDWFTEGFDTKDLKEAKALLEQLAA
jgi:class 3 adenylate cyclase/tetratricopeptide (TPR) repeat protein